MDTRYYREAFVKTKVKDTGEWLILDLPFLITHMTVCQNNVCHYCNLSSSMIGQEVLAYVHYLKEDEEKVKKYEGYLGDKWKDVSKLADSTKHWNFTKENAYATTSELGAVSKYGESDKLDVVHPYMAVDINEK